MYYRVAIQKHGDQLERPVSWQWKSTPLSSLHTLFQFLQLYGALRLDHLRVFSSSSQEGLEEQLVQENKGCGFPSITAARFLQERRINSPAGTQEKSEREGGMYRQMASIAVARQPVVTESSREAYGPVGMDMSPVERRRLELELGSGGDRDVPYSFVLPPSMPQVLAWVRLLASRQRGVLQS